MPGSTNQIQTPFGSGVPSILALAPGVAGGLSSLPPNPNISYTGTLYGAYLTVWQDSIVSADGYTTPVIVANYDNAAANGVGLDLLSISTINFGGIQQINNGISSTLSTITSFIANSLIQINTDISVSINQLSTFSMTSLAYVGGNLTMSFGTLTGAVSFPSLKYVGNSFGPVGATVTSLSVPLLSYVGNSFGGIFSTATSVDFSGLQYVGGLLNPTFTLLTTMNFPALVRVLAAISLTSCPALTTFSLGSTLKQVGNNVLITGAALNQASVDGILVSLAALDGTNGTTTYSGFAVTLTGGTSSAPSATGLTAKATLQGRGCTVTTN